MIIQRSISEPIRHDLDFSSKWHDVDGGLIACWERGREKALENPELADAAKRGELVPLPWKGGVDSKISTTNKLGSHCYYAMWLGLRGDDLLVDISSQFVITCSRFKVPITFVSNRAILNAGD